MVAEPFLQLPPASLISYTGPMADDIYRKIAPYYDRLHRALTADIDFLLTLAGKTGGPVLELGCGTGRLLVPLARAGYQVTGLDNAESMLVRARRRLEAEPSTVEERVQLIAADMKAFFLAHKAYQLAIVPYNTFLHVEPADAISVCRTIARHLAPGARFFLDLPNPHLLVQAPNDRLLTLEDTIRDAETGDLVVVQASHWLEEDSQRLHITWIYDISPESGGPVQRTVAEVSYHYYFLHQLELILQEANLFLEAVYGDYERTPFVEESERLLLVARKRPL